MIPPIRKTLTVPVTPGDAFRIFTEDMALWWPLDSHSLSAGAGKSARDVTVTPRKGGHIIETLHDGTKAPWATITDWTPGHRLSMDWYVGRDPSEATTIAVTFTATEAGTRVDLTHSGFEVLGTAAQAVSKGYLTGWDMVLGQNFAKACLRLVA